MLKVNKSLKLKLKFCKSSKNILFNFKLSMYNNIYINLQCKNIYNYKYTYTYNIYKYVNLNIDKNMIVIARKIFILKYIYMYVN